jgi:hypothetical protein
VIVKYCTAHLLAEPSPALIELYSSPKQIWLTQYHVNIVDVWIIDDASVFWVAVEYIRVDFVSVRCMRRYFDLLFVDSYEQ